MKVRIATWNIAGARRMLSMKRFDYSDGEDLEYFVDQLKKLDLGIICIQESHVNSVDSLAKRLGDCLGMIYVAETPGCPSHIDSSYRLTTSIVSKSPYISSHSYLLPHPTFELKFTHNNKVVSAYDRYLQTISFKGFDIATIHTEPLGNFGLNYESGVGRQLSDGIDDVLVSKLSRPLLFAADFNMDSPMDTLSQSAQALGLQSALPNLPTTPHDVCPDHILYSPEWRLNDSGIIHTQSDHFLCWGELQLVDKST